MSAEGEFGGRTRMIFMGESALTDGFRLVGFETYADPEPKAVEKLVRQLIARRENAFLVLDRKLAQQDIPAIRQVRREGGHILVTVVPPLAEPDCFHCQIDDRLQTLLRGSQFATGSST